MGGRSAAAKGSTLEPPGRLPRPFSAAPAEPPEPWSEPGPRSLVPSERSPRAPGHFSPEQTRCSGSPGRSTGQQRGRELTPRRSSSCSYSSEPVQPPGSTSGRARKKRPPSGGRGPSPVRLRPLLAGHAHTTFSLASADTGSLKATPPATTDPIQEELVPEAARLRFSGSRCWEPGCRLPAARCSPRPSVCEGETGKPQSRMTLLQRGFSVSP